ncbi:MAG: type II toxin-antitoxin system VapC family toxin, partial [Hyphomicrobiaceae bacterium]
RLTTVPFDDTQAALAFEANRRYGKGYHSARLNLGDCAAYALARSLDVPLLFKGNDFTQTDIRRAL